MVISELALGLFTSLLYDSFKSIPEEIFDTCEQVYDNTIEKFSNKDYKLTVVQIDTFFHQKNVENAIEKYLKNPNKLDCSSVLIHEFFELFSEEDFSHEDADLILNSFFKILDTEVEKYPELIIYFDHYLAKRTDKTVQEMSLKIQELHEVINGHKANQSKKESGVDFKKSLEEYLKEIIDEDGKTEISQVYTELSAKEILPVTLKFHDKESNREREFEVLELVEKEEKLIISGESGSGKTTTLRWLNFIFATNYLEGKDENVPLYIELDSYIGEERFIKKPFDAYVAMKAEGKGISEDTLKTILIGKAIILLDGFDLLSPIDDFHPYDKISNFVTDYNNCRFIISSRPGFFESIRGSFKVSELEKLTDEKIEIFINRYISNEELADTLKDKILRTQQLKSILSNPMMLYIAIKVAMGRKDKSSDLLPSNRSELYEAFISTLFNHQEEKGKHLCADRIQIENALTDIYFELQCRNEVSCKYSESLKFVKKSSEDPIFKKISPQLILEDCFKLGLLNKNNYHVSYEIHQSFQEYFAAIKLKELFESGIDVSEAFSHPKWEEVIIFTSEMLDCVDEFIDSMISKGELFLASKCVSKASGKTKEKLCAELANKMDSKYEMEKTNAIESLVRVGNVGIGIIIEALKDEDEDRWEIAAEALENIESDTAVPLLINALKDEDENVRWCAAKALGNIKSDTAVQPLINALKDEDENVRSSAAEALGNIKSDTAVQPLINALKDEDENVRISAAEALGNIKSDTAVQPLINALKDEDEDVRWYAAEALGNIESDTTVQLLINALKNEDSYARWSAAEALGYIESDIAVQPLINALKDEDEDVRSSAAQALGKIKPDIAVQPLIDALKDENSNVRWCAAEALGNIESDTATQLLIKALKDENLYLRISAAQSLGNIKSDTNIKLDTAVQPLVNALKDENSNVRWYVAKALGNIKSDTAVQPLINALKDENSNVKWCVAEALRNIKLETTMHLLINALKDKDGFVRGNVAQALGNIKSNKAAQLLINTLKDENGFVRSSATQALGNIKSDTAVQPLINALKDEDTNVRWYAAQALGKIKSDIAVQPLINALKDEDEDVRISAAEALGNIKSDIAVQPLINALKDENSNVRWYAAEALGNIKSDIAVQPLINALKDEDSNVRSSVARALGEICTVKNKEQLEDLLKSDYEFSVNTAFKILYEIEKKERSKMILFKDEKFLKT